MRSGEMILLLANARWMSIFVNLERKLGTNTFVQLRVLVILLLSNEKHKTYTCIIDWSSCTNHLGFCVVEFLQRLCFSNINTVYRADCCGKCFAFFWNKLFLIEAFHRRSYSDHI